MSGETADRSPDELSENQRVVLDGFIGHYSDESVASPAMTAYYDQASAHLKDAFTRSELALTTPSEYYGVMVGLSIGTVWTEELIKRGLSPQDAGEVMRTSLARLFPKDKTIASETDS